MTLAVLAGCAEANCSFSRLLSSRSFDFRLEVGFLEGSFNFFAAKSHDNLFADDDGRERDCRVELAEGVENLGSLVAGHEVHADGVIGDLAFVEKVFSLGAV